MKKLNYFRLPVILALFMGLFGATWAQKKNEASPGTLQKEMEAKKALYRELGIAWPYDDEGRSLDAARTEMYKGTSREALSSADPAVAQKKLHQEFVANKEKWAKENPAKLREYSILLGYETVGAPNFNSANRSASTGMQISQSELQTIPAEKRAYIQSHPDMYQIVNGPVVRATEQDVVAEKQVISAEEMKNFPANKLSEVNAHPEKYVVSSKPAEVKSTEVKSAALKQVISAEELKHMPASKQQHIQSHPELYQVK